MPRQAHWIWGYAIMVCCVLAISLVRAQLFFHYTLVAASAMHHAMIERVRGGWVGRRRDRTPSRAGRREGALDFEPPVSILASRVRRAHPPFQG